MDDKTIKMNLNYYSAYFEALFFADVDCNEDLQRNDYSFTDIDKDCLIAQFKDLDAFFELADPILENTDYDHDQACHDFYFTRCGHGVGFWENDHCEDEQGKLLTEIAKKFGTVNISDDNNTLYLE